MKTKDTERVEDQAGLCAKHGAECVFPEPGSKLGISAQALDGVLPLHGLRHRPEGDTNGWYIWSGDYSEDPDFFQPLHVEHALAAQAIFATYLGLAPGWRFLIGDDGYEDVWFDEALLKD